MSTHAEDKYEGWDRERFIEEIEGLERDVETAEFERDNQDLSDYSDEDVRSEFHARDLGFDADAVTALYESFHLGRMSQAIEIAKRIACAHTGRVL